MILYSHGVDEKKEAVCFQSSFLVIVKPSYFKQFTKNDVDCIHLRVVVECVVDVRDILRGNVLLVGEENLDLEIAVLIIEYQFDKGEFVG